MSINRAMTDKKVELHIVIDKKGVSWVQIVGSSETPQEGRDFYDQILDLVESFDRQVQERLMAKEERIKHDELSKKS